MDGCFPDLGAPVGAWWPVDTGWHCHVFRLESGHAVRLPRRRDVQRHLRMEAGLLSVLEESDVLAPRLQAVCPTHGSMVITWIEGRPLNDRVLRGIGVARIVEQVAAVLRALAVVPVAQAVAVGVQARDLRPVLADFRDRVIPLVDDRRALGLLHEAAALESAKAGRSPRVLLHADIGPAHVLCDHQGLTGVLDWSDAAIGDPATDLAWLLNGCGRRLRDGLVSALELPPELVRRADLMHALGPWWEVTHGLDQQDQVLVARGLAGIRQRLPAS
ncbi:phosphotransferase family protein [Euzebya tangerina]|uniref:phosphotransferase family protein n=1 Tax=Euzebya tangerina TaxID=591198 RepID=UPI000E30FD45|nr:aminoglycoside phosphotransferase family protein [Euzebya tangerina]